MRIIELNAKSLASRTFGADLRSCSVFRSTLEKSSLSGHIQSPIRSIYRAVIKNARKLYAFV